MADDTKALGPWPRGINNVDDQQSSVFQPSRRPDAPLPQLREAVNVDIDRDGWVRRRVGRTKLGDLTNAHSLQLAGDLLLLVNDGDLVFYDPISAAIEAIEAGIGHGKLTSETVAGVIWWTNGSRFGRIVGTTPTFWGLELPVCSGAAASGTMRAARYMFTVTVEAEGVESGSRAPQAIELADNSSIQVSVTNIDPHATHLNIYCTEPNGQTLFFVDQVPVASTISIANTGVSTDPLTTLNHYPPPPGRFAHIHAGRMLIASGDVLYWSQPLAYHHFAISTDLQLFDSDIRLLEVVDGGFYVATSTATWWVGGDDPESWTPQEIDYAPVATGAAIKLAGYKIPGLESSGPVVVWATANGFVAGLSGGKIKALTDGRIAMDTFAEAALAYREERGIRQLLLALHGKKEYNGLGATDRITATVIKANTSPVTIP